jgi:hypothetical protein
MIKVAFVVNNKPDLRPVSRQQSLKSLIQVSVIVSGVMLIRYRA